MKFFFKNRNLKTAFDKNPKSRNKNRKSLKISKFMGISKIDFPIFDI